MDRYTARSRQPTATRYSLRSARNKNNSPTDRAESASTDRNQRTHATALLPRLGRLAAASALRDASASDHRSRQSRRRNHGCRHAVTIHPLTSPASAVGSGMRPPPLSSSPVRQQLSRHCQPAASRRCACCPQIVRQGLLNETCSSINDPFPVQHQPSGPAEKLSLIHDTPSSRTTLDEHPLMAPVRSRQPSLRARRRPRVARKIFTCPAAR